MPFAQAQLPINDEGVDTVQWYALQVRGRLTRTVAEVLQRKGYEAFTPCYAITRRWCDRSGRIESPLFPGYVFTRIDPRHRLPVLTTPGVYSFVGIGKQPLPIPDWEIASIQGVLRSGLPIEPWPFLQRGDHVQIDAGPLAGITGTLIDVKKTYRVVVSVEMIERSIAVEVDRDSVRVLKPA